MTRRLLRIGSIAAAVAIATTTLVGPGPTTATGRTGSIATVAYDPSSFTTTVTSSLTVAVGGTFTLANTLKSGNDNPSYYVALVNRTGSVRLGSENCTGAPACRILDRFAGTASGVFTVTGLGTVDVLRVYNSGDPSLVGTITIANEVAKSITITKSGRRDTPIEKKQAPSVRAKTDRIYVYVKGRTTGLPIGTKLTVMFRFPGQTSFSASTSTVTVGPEGRWAWSRKTGKKIVIYVESGSVKSARVTVSAR